MTATSAAAWWSAIDIPDQTGSTAVVTGASVPRAGDHRRTRPTRRPVIAAVRNLDKGAAAGQIRAQVLGARRELCHLDLADLDSAHAFAAGDLSTLDLLINNAGVMMPPLTRTVPSPELTRIKASSSWPSHDPAVAIATDAPDVDASAA
ncbi:hypothetical protein [Streptomyces sp. YU58]|uniref:hypothetical protein n=1 Tax=Streptomyces sp. SX92 TaxID=3158972 RepID=UPI0027B91FC1|nr:hypothetical protein [Streptomyces coralus]WLW50244.1 hypothetical protein QU709_02220 [Streptomyces coralus]